VELNLLHMVTVDPQRTPTMVMFANADYFFFRGGPTCAPISAQTPGACLSQSSAFAWQHGGFQPEIVTTWLGMVGPGIKHLGQTDEIWSDHADVRPTILSLIGLKDDYASDGRVMIEAIEARDASGARVAMQELIDGNSWGKLNQRPLACQAPGQFERTLRSSFCCVATKRR